MNTPNNDAIRVEQHTTIIDNILNTTGVFQKSRRLFIRHLLPLLLLVRGRNNFTNFARYGSYTEKYYRNHFEQPFDWLTFNTTLAKEYTGENRILAFDPSFLLKSRQHTPHVGTFWSGVAGKALHGLEIGSLAVVDLERNTALSLEAVQTPNSSELKEKDETLTDHYTNLIIERKESLEQISKYLAVDGYFGKKKFFDGILDTTKLHLITKLRTDADLQYLYTGAQRQGRGRPKQFDGKVDWNNFKVERFGLTVSDEKTTLLSSLLWSPTLKRRLHVVVVLVRKKEGFQKVAILASSDTTLAALTIFEYYTKRFQIEFLFRDAKQHAGLTHCQARSENKLHFHINASLTAVSVAKVAHFFDRTDPTYSLTDVGMAYFNQFFTNLFFSKLDFEPTSDKISSVLPSLLNFGLIHSG
jgi:hypothetical protein